MSPIRTRFAAALLILAWVVPASAGETAWKSFKLRGKTVSFQRVPARDLIVSSDCMGKGGVPDCDASRATARATLRKVQAAEPDYQLGRDVCILVGGEPETGDSNDGGESVFCQFRDGTWISGVSLVHHAVENDKLSRVK